MDYYKLGVACGVVAGIVIVAIAVLVIKARGGKGALFSFDFDERQQLARGKAFKWAFIVLAAYLLADGLADALLENPWAERMTANFVGILLSVTVFAVQCIMHDAYFAISEKPRSVLVLIGVIAVLNVLAGVMNYISHGGFTENGMLSFHALNPLCAGVLIAILIACIVRRRQGERADEE